MARLTNLFAVWVVLGTIWAFVIPEHHTWFRPFIPGALGVVMLGMGLTLRFDDFQSVVAQPVSVLIGVVAQFTIMPSLAYAVAKLFNLPPDLAVGLILVGCCPGGTASNIIAYLSRANLALSVLMTMSSTILSVALTPLLTRWMAGQYMEVDAWKMLIDMLTIVLLPVLAGMVLNELFPKFVKRAQVVSPLVSVFAVTMIVACIVALNGEKIAEHWRVILAAVCLFDTAGFALGYLAARLLRQPERFCRTVAIEVGMQNSGLAVTLANKHFGHAPLTSVPGAIAAVYHCLIGSLLATVWRLRPIEDEPDEANQR